MALLGMLSQLSLLIFVAAISAASHLNSRCNRRCGSLEIPYPFGTNDGCYHDKYFLITCNHSSEPPKPFLRLSDWEVLNISLDGEIIILGPVARDCNSQSGQSEDNGRHFHNDPQWREISLSKFRISSKRNKITAVGCDTYSYIRFYNEDKYYTTGCLSLCDPINSVKNGSCTGIGCCQISIPEGASDYDLRVRSLNNPSKSYNYTPCGFGFIVDEKAYKFSSADLKDLQNRTSLPLVLDWTIGNETCKNAKKNWTSFACKESMSTCHDSTSDSGYVCKCSKGFQGNPYLRNGCEDINECKTSNPCNTTCVNTPGSYKCYCPKGFEGDGLRNGTGCSRKDIKYMNTIISIPLGVTTGLLVLLLGTFWVYWVLKNRKLIKLKEKFFQQNGGLMLRQQLSNQTRSVETAKIFSAKELEKATNNYDESRVLGRGGHGTVYKGILPDNKVVAIKKSIICDQSQIEQFINEVIVLIQINHKNVVKLLGCCLETEVPLLVYEFITNGTLYHHIHDRRMSSALSWSKRLKIATETAGALAYLHCETSMPIIHRDVKTANILLDDTLTTKVSDFGASRLVPVDHKQVTTLVQGTMGYLDPEYFHTSQLTDKSDVYSFGVVLAELLTGKKALSFDRPENEKNLAKYFVFLAKEDQLFQILENDILEEGNIEEVKQVADIAKRCLGVRGEDRPTMKEVAMELEGLRSMNLKHLLRKADLGMEKTEYLLSPTTTSMTTDVTTECSSTSTTIGCDSMGSQVQKPTNDGMISQC